MIISLVNVPFENYNGTFEARIPTEKLNNRSSLPDAAEDFEAALREI